jgi:hypothetical protein
MLKVILETRESEALQVLAEREFRDPRAQAALIIRRALEDAGLLPPGAGTQPGAEPGGDDSRALVIELAGVATNDTPA